VNLSTYSLTVAPLSFYQPWVGFEFIVGRLQFVASTKSPKFTDAGKIDKTVKI
jgi:hypothetical protein